MDYLIAHLSWYALAAFVIGFAVAWIACAKVEG